MNRYISYDHAVAETAVAVSLGTVWLRLGLQVVWAKALGPLKVR